MSDVGNRRRSIGKQFYLDTSALLGLGTTLRTLRTASDSYTSIIAAIEIVAAIRADQSAYRRGRAILCVLLDSPIVVVETLPEEIIFNAFPVLHEKFTFDASRTDLLKALVLAIADAECLSEFEAVLSSKSWLMEAMIDFERYDLEAGEHYASASARGHAKSREAYKLCEQGMEVLPEELGIPIDASYADYWRLMHEQGIHTNIGILAQAELFAERCGLPDPKDASVTIAESYDGSIDPYFVASSFVDSQRAARQEPAARNDGIDLMHFVYLVPGVELVCDDRRMRATAEAIGWPVRTSASLRSP